ncbi:MAG TPA: NAD(P)/FAD-dependent oxidoreductase [Solirubrobacteraceae bacterium]
MTRVVVVGAGSNGLVAAIHLARAGLDVEVLEHGPGPGGASSSAELTLPGFVHDRHAGFNPITMVSPAMRELDLRVDWVNPPTPMAYPLPGGTAIALERDVEATAASLEAAGRGAGDGWRRLMARTVPNAERLGALFLGRLPPVRAAAVIALALRSEGLEMARRAIGSVEALGREVFAGADGPMAWLASSAQHSGLPPGAAGTGAFGLLLHVVGHSHGWPFPRGGMQVLADELARLAAEAGARVRCEARVERILVRRGRACGVGLAGGEELGADAIVTTVSARPLAAMLPDGALPARLMHRLRVWRYGTDAFKADYALSGPVPWTAPEARRAAVVQVAGELRELARAGDQATHGEVPDRPALVVGQHTLFDETRAPAGRHTLYVYAHVPSRPAMDDEAIAERMEAQLERFAPGFRALVLARTLRPARETERQNPSLVGGDLAGGAYEIDQLAVFRPAPRLCRGRTPLRGLYVAGASVHPGGAVHGMSGRAAARALLADRRLRPWRPWARPAG